MDIYSDRKHNYLNFSVLPPPYNGGNENLFTVPRHVSKLVAGRWGRVHDSGLGHAVYHDPCLLMQLIAI